MEGRAARPVGEVNEASGAGEAGGVTPSMTTEWVAGASDVAACTGGMLADGTASSNALDAMVTVLVDAEALRETEGGLGMGDGSFVASLDGLSVSVEEGGGVGLGEVLAGFSAC